MNKIYCISIFIGIWFLPVKLICGSKPNPKHNKNGHYTHSSMKSDCSRPTATYDMNVNNVRARLHNGGTLFEGGQYITPNKASGTSNVSGIHAAGIWLGGKDRAGNIRLAASDYQQNGSDFFSGPLNYDGATEKQFCDDWDKIFTVKGKNIEDHISAWNKAKENNLPYDCAKIPDDVKYWPAQGNPYWNEKYPWSLPNQTLAEYWDYDSNGKYDPCKGDYPIVLRSGCEVGYSQSPYLPTEINFFVFNDIGGPQTLSGPNKIQMEVQVSAYAYNTKNEVNDMTFYQYKMVNKASEDLIDFYFGFWVDPDLGCYSDDYFGYDKTSDVAYIYNQDAVDGDGSDCNGDNTYSENIPMIGLSFLLKPYGPKVFKRDTNGKFVVDQFGQKILIDPIPNTGAQDTVVEIGISSFTYSDNCGLPGSSFPPATCYPRRGREEGFYNYIRGFWADGTPFTFGGSGFNPSSSDTVRLAFPGSPNDDAEWSMCTSGLPYSERKFYMSAGPLLLQPGAANLVTVNIFSVFDVPLPCPDLTKMRYINGVTQWFFGNCFNEPQEGPDAPDVSCIEKDKELILILKNNKDWSNNYDESFSEATLYLPPGFDDQYRFEGYKIYQLKDESVRYNQYTDPSFARLVAQTDIKNNVADIYNWFPIENPDTSAFAYPYIWQPKLMISGANLGIKHTFTITEDQFSDEEKSLVNGKKYYFSAVAYAHNEWRPYNTQDNYGQRTSYIDGRVNIQNYSFIPQQNENQIESQLKVTRISGEGNPNVFLDVTSDMYDKMLANDFDGKITYRTGFGPLVGKILDPSKLKDKKYRLEITGNFNYSRPICTYDDEATWTLTNITDNVVVLENKPLFYIKEYVVDELGFSITVENRPEPASQTSDVQKGGIGAKIDYLNPDGPKWFGAVTYEHNILNKPDNFLNFISQRPQDPNLELSTLGTGYFVPFISTRYESASSPYLSPAAIELMPFMLGSSVNSLRYRDLNNVDIIMTKDKTKWSKCMVVESTSPDFVSSGTLGNRKNFELRNDPSIDQNGNPINDGTTGFSYFPGYAVDVETGERLNIFFGESSLYADTIINLNGTLTNLKTLLKDEVTLGGDMIFNPSSQVVIEDLVIRDPITDEIITFLDSRALVAGGQHYIYVTRQVYDGCASFASRLQKTLNGATSNNLNRGKVGAAITWTSFPVLTSEAQLLPLSEGLIPNDVIIKMRVDNLYGESRVYNIERERDCETVGDQPVYEFGFDTLNAFIKSERELGNVYLAPNPVSLGESAFALKLFNLPQDVQISIINIGGSVVKTYGITEGVCSFLSGPGVTETRYDIEPYRLSQGLYFVHIRNSKTGESKTLKWLVL
jgi:hypothetical protein